MKKRPTKKVTDLLSELGTDYVLKVIDCEICITKPIGSKYEIEISGINGHERDMFCNYICVWDLETMQSVEYIRDIKTKNQLFHLLLETSDKYLKLVEVTAE